MQQDAIALLRDDSPYWSATTKDWLLRAAMLSAIANRDYAAVGAIDRDLGSHVVGNTITLPHRSYMLAYAEQRLAHESGTARK